MLSMTGFGDSRGENERVSIAVEVRAVNNRYLKVSAKYPETYASLEPRIEKLIRNSISRGSVSVNIRANRLDGARRCLLDAQALGQYWEQLTQFSIDVGTRPPERVEHLLALPGVLQEEVRDGDEANADWPLIKDALAAALESLTDFRRREGESMRADLVVNCRVIQDQLAEIERVVPQVVIEYRDRLKERVNELLQDHGTEIDEVVLIREVSIFAERADVNEEITRLHSHLEQFAAFLNDGGSSGRKLEFLSQEINREVNTIGSKANNVAIAHCVVEMKAAVEKIREILQNVE